jgi:hypothetical protein
VSALMLEQDQTKCNKTLIRFLSNSSVSFA